FGGGGKAGERAHVVGDIVNVGALENAVAAERGHGRALPRVRIAGSHAVANGLRDLVERAAPDLFVVVEIGIAARAGTARAMARGAILRESGARLCAREFKELRVGRDLLQRRSGEA